MAVRRVLVALVFACLLVPATSFAQSAWGVMVSGAPQWKFPGFITDQVAGDGGSLSVKGNAFYIGIVHGRDLGGDWGVSFVREKVKDGSSLIDGDQQCFSNGCFPTGTDAMTTGVKMTGVEVHVLFRFTRSLGTCRSASISGAAWPASAAT
jgi:hypothetical protein